MSNYKNHQWAVTDFGLEATAPVTGGYSIEASKLLEEGFSERSGLYDWPLHLAEKSWVDIEAFIEAFCNAIETHKGKYEGDINVDILEASLSAARALNKKHYG